LINSFHPQAYPVCGAHRVAPQLASAGFLLRHDRIYRGARAWTLVYRRWLTTVRFDHPAQQIVLQDYIHAVEDAEARRDRLTRQIEELLPSWSMAPVVKALQAMRGAPWSLQSPLWRKWATSAASPTPGS
jgi:hypothetical protein